MTQFFKNNAFASLAAELLAAGTLATLASGQGARFPSPTGGDHFLATLILLDGNGAETAWEIVKCTARATDGLTIERAQEGTTARIWPAGTRMEMRTTAGTLDSFTTLRAGLFAGNVQQVDQPPATIVRAATTVLAGSLNCEISDTGVAVAAFNGTAGATYNVKFLGAGDITHGAGLSILQNGANITTAAGDTARVRMLTGTTCEVFDYQRASGAALVRWGDDGLFIKADPSSVAFTKTGAGTAQIKAGTKIDVANTLVEFNVATAITMPTLTAGTDYAIWVKTDGTIQADASFSTAPGAGKWRKIGGFHYAPGGNATAQAGGDAIPAINEYSFWDLKFKPSCPDPRGMTLVAGSFWIDIYLLGVDHHINGTSKYNVTIADGNTPPKIPTKFGGNGTTTYTTLNWWEANEVLQSHGKRPPTYDEAALAFYGTTEATASSGTDVPTTGVTGTGATSAWNVFTSKWGVIQSTGCKWVWGRNFGGGTQTGWAANTAGHGSTLQLEDVSLFGGAWELTTQAGSRCSIWNAQVPTSYANTTTRGVCNHLIIE